MAWIKKIFGWEKPAGARPHCVPNSILCAWTWGAIKKDPVRISVTKIGNGIDHSQAQACVNGEWTPLTELWNADGGYLEVVLWKPHFPQEPYRYLTLQDWIAEQIKYTE
jgi:hypothetical protein